MKYEYIIYSCLDHAKFLDVWNGQPSRLAAEN
jgi:hypothetical protein